MLTTVSGRQKTLVIFPRNVMILKAGKTPPTSIIFNPFQWKCFQNFLTNFFVFCLFSSFYQPNSAFVVCILYKLLRRMMYMKGRDKTVNWDTLLLCKSFFRSGSILQHMHLPNHALVTDPWSVTFCLAKRLRMLKMKTSFAGASTRTATSQANQ